MYGFLLTLAIFISLSIAEKQTVKQGLSRDTLWSAAFWAILLGIVGARLYHVIDFWAVYKTNPIAVIQIWRGGLGIFGALLFGGITFIAILKRKKENVLKWLDIIALPLPMAQSIGRLGNYFNNEILPYALYESLADFLLFFILLYINRKSEKSGVLFATYLVGYSLIRILLEPVKSDPWVISGINVAQAISVLILITSSTLLLKWRKKLKQ